MSLQSFRHDERGQALFETALFMPIFILGFFSVIFAVSYSALSERVQLGVRYGGTVANIQNPYLSYSLYSMYDMIDGNNPIDVATCGGAKASIPTLIAARAALWQPVATSISAPPCSGAIGAVQLSTDGGLIESSIIQLTASAPLSGYLTTRVFGAAQNEGTTSATANFFRSPDIGQLLGCSTVGAAVKTSLEGYYDNATPVTVPTPLPIALPTHQVIIFPVTCHTFGPFPTPPASVTPPPHNASPTPSPSPTPTRSPPPTASPVPTVPPTASPRPTPTASPAPTPTPTASPVRTPSPSPTASPVRTASPTPTASPVPTPTPTPTPSPSPTPIPTPPIGIHF